MKWGQKCGLFVLSLALLFVPQFTLFSDDANAFAPTMTICDDVNVGWDWYSNLKIKDPTYHTSGHESFVLFGFHESGSVDPWQYLIYTHDSEKFNFYSDSTTNYMTVPDGSKRTYFSGSSATADSYSALQAVQVGDSATQMNVGSTRITCMKQNYGITYSSSWTTAGNAPMSGLPPLSDVEQGEADSCAPGDIICAIGGFFRGIGDGFNAVGQAILQGIAALFIPNANIFADQFDVLADFFTAKFGFLSFPLTFIVDLLTALTTNNIYYFPADIDGPGAYIPFSGTFFGGEVKLDYGALGYLSGDYIGVIRSILIAVTIVALVYGFHRKYMGLIKS